MRLFKLAADQGYAPAQFNLGLMYADLGLMYAGFNLGLTDGVQPDYVAAHMWFNLAAAGGLREALTLRELVAAKMAPEQIAEAEKRFAEWRRGGPIP